MNYKFDLLPKKGSFRIDGRWILVSVVFSLAFLFGSSFILLKLDISPNALTFILFLAFGGQYIWSLISRRRYNRSVSAFAEANMLPAMDTRKVETQPPVLDRSGAHNEQVWNQYTFDLGKQNCTVYDYSFDIGSGRNQRTYYYSIAHLQIEKSFPHIFLDGRGNRLSGIYAHKQKLGLEGDFDNYFTLYLPDGEQVDVLSIISPDVMQTLINSGRPYDIEINGRDVYICSGRPFYTQTALPHLLTFSGRLAAELDQRTVSWREAMPGHPAPQLEVAFWKSAKGRVLLVCIPVALYVVINIYISTQYN